MLRFIKTLFDFPDQNSVHLVYTGDVIPLKEFSKVISYRALASDFDDYFISSGLMGDRNYLYQDMDLSVAFYRDYFQMYYTMAQYEELLRLVEAGKKIKVRVGDPYLRRIFKAYRRHGFKNVKLSGDAYQAARTFLAEVIKLFLNAVTLVRSPFFLLGKEKCAVHTSNNFGPTGRFDYRIGETLLALKSKGIPLLFLIRTNHGPVKILKHYFMRDVPCFYTDAIISACELTARLIPSSRLRVKSKEGDLKKQIVFDRLTHGIPGIVFALRALSLFFSYLKMPVLFSADTSERSILEVAACKQIGITVVGAQNGTEWAFFQVHKFLRPAEENVSYMVQDRFGVWSDGWLSYFDRNSRIYSTDIMSVSGFYRNQGKDITDLPAAAYKPKKILWLIENLTPIDEIAPYLEALISHNYTVYLKVRPQQNDAGDETAERIIEVFGKQHFSIVDSPIEDCVSDYDLALGCYTSALLDAGLGGVPVLVLHSETWGDAFELEGQESVAKAYCKTPKELIERIQRLPLKDIQSFIDLYAPSPNLLGSEWVAEQVSQVLS